jgi:hypothetical protein
MEIADIPFDKCTLSLFSCSQGTLADRIFLRHTRSPSLLLGTGSTFDLSYRGQVFWFCATTGDAASGGVLDFTESGTKTVAVREPLALSYALPADSR